MMDPTQSDDLEQQLRELAEAWAAAEGRGDAAFLARTLADDFVGVGPRGFLLRKEEWLQRYTSGELMHDAFILDDVRVRVYGEAAILIGRETERGRYQGHDIAGQFRATLVWVRQRERWLLAGLHLSPIAERP